MSTDMRTLAQVFYDAWVQATQGRYPNGSPMARWDSLYPVERDALALAVAAVIRAYGVSIATPAESTTVLPFDGDDTPLEAGDAQTTGDLRWLPTTPVETAQARSSVVPEIETIPVDSESALGAAAALGVMIDEDLIARDARLRLTFPDLPVWSDDVTTVSFRTADGARVVIGDAEAVLAQVRYNLDLAAGKLDALEVEPVTSEDAQAVQALVDPFKSIEQRAREQVQAATVQHQDAAAGTDDALGRLPPAALPDIQRLIADVDAEQDQRDDPIAELRKSFKARGGGV